MSWLFLNLSRLDKVNPLIEFYLSQAFIQALFSTAVFSKDSVSLLFA